MFLGWFLFEGSFFGGIQNIWGNPYLNSTTIHTYIHANAFQKTISVNYTVGVHPKASCGHMLDLKIYNVFIPL